MALSLLIARVVDECRSGGPVGGRRRRGSALAVVTVLVLLAGPVDVRAARVKDIASVKGVRSNQLIGYGLIVGLNGTGDRDQTEFTVQSLSSMLARMGIGVDAEEVQVRNVAAVMVTAELPPFSRAGSTLDALVSSIGDATSLEGGTLVMTPLFAADGNVYAIAQGAISVGGFAAGGGAGSSVQKNHPTVGRLASGATIERELEFAIDEQGSFLVALDEADFTTAMRMTEAINRHFGSPVAKASDPGTVRIDLPEAFRDRVVPFMAELEAVELTPDRLARVIVNERTGTIVMGSDVRISKVAVSHGNLSVTISALNEISQPAPFSRVGQTERVRNEAVETTEDEAQLIVVPDSVTIEALVQGLNAIGVTPRDLISILQAIKAAGALSAELELI